MLLIVRLRNNRINGNRISEKQQQQQKDNHKKQTNKQTKKARVTRERTDMRMRNCHTLRNITRFTRDFLSLIFQLITCTESTREDEHQELSAFLTSRLCEEQNVSENKLGFKGSWSTLVGHARLSRSNFPKSEPLLSGTECNAFALIPKTK